MSGEFGRSRRLSAATSSVNNNSQSPYQSYVLKRGEGIVMKPSWTHTTIFRILPGLNPDNPSELDPWRLSTRADEYGQWFFPVDVASVSCEANNKTARSWVIRDPFDSGYNINNNPLVLLVNSAKNAIDKEQPFAIRWVNLMKGGQGRSAELVPPKESWLVRCFVMEHNDKIFDVPRGFGPEEKTAFMLLTVSAVSAIKRAMDERKPDFRGDDDDIAGHYVHGDPVSVDDGAYIVLFNKEKDPRNQASFNGQSAFNQGSYTKVGKTEVRGYDAFIQKQYRGGSAGLREVYDVVMSKLKLWQDVVYIPSDEEQVKYLEQVFRPFSDLLVYGLDDTYGNVLDQKIRREGLVKLGRMRPVDHIPEAAPATPVQHVAPARPAASPVPQTGGNFFARAAAVVEAQRAISESPDVPVVPPAAPVAPTAPSVASNADATVAMEAIARARREAMRGGSVPKPSSAN